MMSSIAKHMAERIRMSDCGLKVAAVGLNTMRQPMKPPKLASQRSLPTFSPRSTFAKSILKKGIVLFTTTQEAKGSTRSPKHHRPMPSANNRPLTPCIHSRVVRKPSAPLTSNRGKSTNPAAAKRMKTIWGADKLPPRNFMMPSLPMPITKCDKYHAMPVRYVVLAETPTEEASSLGSAANGTVLAFRSCPGAAGCRRPLAMPLREATP
mmetsp:Transcript_90817/g.256507  ORF Transcript_90817/g.256507 Transcript_90817/m.256507 type:complete len:209 (+) Transcript_90817:524-1150(+)